MADTNQDGFSGGRFEQTELSNVAVDERGGYPSSARAWDPRLAEVIRSPTERFWRSARAADVEHEWAKDGVDVGAFLERHAALGRTEAWAYDTLSTEDSTFVRGRTVRWAHRARLSTLDVEGDIMRLVLVDTCERRLLLEAFDVRAMLERDPLPPVTLQLCRQAAEFGRAAEGASAAVRLLLDELERASLWRVLTEAGVEDGL